MKLADIIENSDIDVMMLSDLFSRVTDQLDTEIDRYPDGIVKKEKKKQRKAYYDMMRHVKTNQKFAHNIWKKLSTTVRSPALRNASDKEKNHLSRFDAGMF